MRTQVKAIIQNFLSAAEAEKELNTLVNISKAVETFTKLALLLEDRELAGTEDFQPGGVETDPLIEVSTEELLERLKTLSN